jgi:hypothetical protein
MGFPSLRPQQRHIVEAVVSRYEMTLLCPRARSPGVEIRQRVCDGSSVEAVVWGYLK